MADVQVLDVVHSPGTLVTKATQDSQGASSLIKISLCVGLVDL